MTNDLLAIRANAEQKHPLDPEPTLALCDEIESLIARVDELRQELTNIAMANPRQWDDIEKGDHDHQFRLWAQSRARFTLGKTEAPCAVCGDIGGHYPQCPAGGAP